MARATASTRFHTSVEGGSKSRVPLTALIKVVWEIPCYHVGTRGDGDRQDCQRIPGRLRLEFAGSLVCPRGSYILLASTFTNSCTDAALLCSFAVSSSVSLISYIFSIPAAPNFTGTPTNSPWMPYSPSRYAAHGRTFFLSFRIDSAISTAAADGA